MLFKGGPLRSKSLKQSFTKIKSSTWIENSAKDQTNILRIKMQTILSAILYSTRKKQR
jgi:hypothetical protein